MPIRSFIAMLLLTPLTLAQETAPPLFAADTPIIDYQNPQLPGYGRIGMVVSPEKLAGDIGLDMLKQGGNAIDAAVATGFALAVTLPRAGNLGGGGFMLVHLAESDEQIFIDYRETAPAAATRDMFLNADGTVNKSKAYFSRQAAGVPGTVAGLIHAQSKYGTLPLATVIQPAIDLAEQGFDTPLALHMSLTSRAERLAMDPEAKRVYLQGTANAPAPGALFKQPDLAHTLQRIRDKGRDGFYGGETAALIAADMAANDGLITADDLAGYRTLERSPVRGTFNEFEIVSVAPPSSGGIHILQMLNLLEPYPLKSYGHNSAEYLHRLIESMKLAYADRSRYLGDPDQTVVPTESLISKEYADERRQLITANRANTAASVGPGNPIPAESRDTTHYSVADAQGNVVANTYTLNFSFGSHIVVPGTGILLNNEMDDFAAKAGAANAYGLVQGEANTVAPNRRPLSSMTPTIVFKDGQPWLATGSPGGSLIITTVLQTLLNAMVFDMNIATAVAAPRVHNQWMPDRTLVEPGISVDTQRILEAWGHNLTLTQRTIGRANSLMIEDGWLQGFADLRRPGGHVATE
ncbi:MAG: gamma-glutamyltransferase [Halieaceae bacterium]|jgi:gamma-glutamyltranspeptidase/glutathione hydrolase|nr:gamma-glutamyltransferase [Halieaceae bacterium]